MKNLVMLEYINRSALLERFTIAEVYNACIVHETFTPLLPNLKEYFSEGEIKKITQSLLRFSFYIEPVKQPTIDSTKFTNRWNAQLEDDPRFADYETCLQIFLKLLNELLVACRTPVNTEMVKLILKKTAYSYELNIDYNQRLLTNIHTPENCSFFWDQELLKCFHLRQFLLSDLSKEDIAFFDQTYSKVIVKSYLTDRVLTGTHKTNREKRWECHPGSVHFALRKEAIKIEYKLIKQICEMHDFPGEIKQALIDKNILENTGEITKCPVTLKLLSFNSFKEEVLNPVHGKSSLQVGHLHPLKSILANQDSGHTANNISWISALGNRIQGDLSVEETRSEIIQIIQAYRQDGLIN